MDEDPHVVIVPESAMAVGAATVRLFGLPVHEDGHGRRHVTEADRELLRTRVERDVDAATVTTFRRHVRCGRCEADLVFPSRRSERPVPVPLADGVVTVVVEADWARCSACGTDHLDPAVGLDRVLAALDAALDRAATDIEGT